MLPPRPGHVPWARLTQPRAIVSLLLLAGQVLPPVQASAYTLSQTGRWTPTQAWEQTPVHLMLLRGTGAPSHSTVLWWVGTGQHEQFYGGLWGWRAGSYDCSTYPDTSVLKRLPFDLPGAASLFCAGHSQLADGKAFLSGGTQPGTEFGIRTTYTFTAGADSNQAWLERDSLESARWYPAATTLASGDALVTSGSHFQHLHFFGGLKDSESAPTDSAVFRYGIGEGGVSQEPVRTSSSPIWPSPREGHSSVYYSYGGPTRIFGGKLQDGRYSQEVWQMRREQNPAAADYDYDWERVTPDASPPARWRHIAVNTEQAAAPMLLFGGILKNGLGQDEAANDVWRYWFQTGVGYTWSAVNITNPTSSDAPGARNGHVALWHQPSRSTLVFGGRSTPTGNPTDSALYRLAFSTDMTSATWSKLTATGPGPRAEMALAYNTAWTNGPATFAFTFGGNLASGKSKQLWELKLGADPDTARWREITYLGGTPPSPRSGHTLLADGGNRWLYLFGGTSPAGSDDDTVYVARLDSLKMLLGELRQWAPYARHSVSLTGHTAVFEDGAIFARKPELYSPGTNSWSTLSSPRLQEWYPQAFVLKSDTVYFAGPDVFGRKLALSTGNWSVFPQDSTAGFKGGTSVMYRPGKIMKAGSRDGSSGAASGTTRSVDLTAGTGAYWRASSNSMAPRVNHNLVILPNGQVLATGGTSSLGNDNNSSAEFRPELWDPDYGSGAGQWNGLGVLDSMPTLRDYHSTALLLPDGRVLTGGGNSDKQTRGSAEIYCPPYLYGGDTLAVRPTLLATTGRWRYGAGVTIAVSGDTTIRRACLIHPGSVTHGHDQAQRYVPLTLQSSAVRDDGVRQYFLSAPPDSFIAPPGDYLLFVSNSGGVPSIAQWVRVGATESGQYDTTAPDTLSLAAEFITCDGIYPLTWAAPGDNAATGTALDFDVRYSTSAITEGNFQSATQVTGLPIPHLAGTIQQGDDLTSLQTCTHYYFAAKTRDRAGNWSALGRVKYKTLCVGGSCGGGGLSMSRSREDAAGSSGSRSTTARRAGERGLAAPAGLSQSGSSIRLMGEFDSGTAARWRLGYRDLEGQSALLAATGQALVVQVPGAGGSWQARSSLAPGAGLLGVRSLRSAGRVVFPAGASLESVELEPLGFECTMAEHSRLGDLQDPAGSIDESDFVVDDTLEIAYQVAAEAQSGEDCFFKVSIPGASQPSAAAPRVRAPAAPDLPVEFALEAPWPNPFSGATSIRFDLPRASTVKVEVFDVQGRKVTVLAGQALPAGRHSVQWSGRNERGERAAAGVYLCRLTAGSFVAERRMTLLP